MKYTGPERRQRPSFLQLGLLIALALLFMYGLGIITGIEADKKRAIKACEDIYGGK